MSKVKDNLRIAIVCVVIAFVCLFGYLMLQNLSSELFIRLGLATRKDGDLFGNYGFWITFFIAAIFFPVFEESVFRLLACKLLKLTKMPDCCVIVLSALLFALYHQSWSQLVYQFLMGVWFAWIFMKTHQIGWTMLIHFINNAFIVTYTYFAGDGNNVFNLNAGSVILALSLAVVTTIAVFFLIKKGIPKYEK